MTQHKMHSWQFPNYMRFNFIVAFDQTFRLILRSIPMTILAIAIFIGVDFIIFLTLELFGPFFWSSPVSSWAVFGVMLAWVVAYHGFHAWCLKQLCGHWGECAEEGAARKIGAIHIVVLTIFGAIYLLSTLIGYQFFVIPGAILAVGWLLVGPCYLFENCGAFGAFGASWELTSGSRWRIFWLQAAINLLLTVCILGLLVWIADSHEAPLQTKDPGYQTWMIHVLLIPIVAIQSALISSVYAECRRLENEKVSFAADTIQDAHDPEDYVVI